MGNPNEFTIIELAEKVLKLTKSKSKITYKPLPQDDPIQRKPDIKLAKKMLNNWTPEYFSLDEGLTYTIEYFKKLSSRLFPWNASWISWSCLFVRCV